MRKFELKNETSKNFCEFWIVGNTLHGRFGKSGTNGIPYLKECNSATAAKSEMDSKILTITKKGYAEVETGKTEKLEVPSVNKNTVFVEDVLEESQINIPEENLKALEAEYFNGTSLDKALTEKFGFFQFRTSQREAIYRLLNEQRLLCILPTGHGKSLLFQLPASILPGVTIVFSPLKALMRDQTQKLREQFGISAASLDSDMDYPARKKVEDDLKSGQLKLLYIAPEQLNRIDIQQLLSKTEISMVVVDEAHCISSWGHDFRPAFREIRNFIKSIHDKNSKLLVLGLTATANNKVASDISDQFSFVTGEKMKILRTSANRPNLALSVLELNNEDHKLKTLIEILNREKVVTVVYCATKKSTESVEYELSQAGFKSGFFHGGVNKEKRHTIQNKFLKNEFEVIVATNSLGMGVDKPDIRRVIHYEHPGNLTNYYQEIGRAGRDGKPAKCVLLFSKKDRKIQEFLLSQKRVKASDVDKIISAVRIVNVEGEDKATLNNISLFTDLNKDFVERILVDLIEQGLVVKEIVGGEWVYRTTDKKVKPNYGLYEALYQKGINELDRMLDYASQENGCYMAVLRKELGDDSVKPCGQCGLCKGEKIKGFGRNDLQEHKTNKYSSRSFSKATSEGPEKNLNKHADDKKPWSSKEDNLLRELSAKKMKLRNIHHYFLRTRRNIEKRLIELGLPFIKQGKLVEGKRPTTPKTPEKAYSVVKIRQTHAKAYMPWTPADDKLLHDLFKQGKKTWEIAERLGRNTGAINSRLNKIGLVS